MPLSSPHHNTLMRVDGRRNVRGGESRATLDSHEQKTARRPRPESPPAGLARRWLHAHAAKLCRRAASNNGARIAQRPRRPPPGGLPFPPPKPQPQPHRWVCPRTQPRSRTVSRTQASALIRVWEGACAIRNPRPSPSAIALRANFIDAQATVSASLQSHQSQSSDFSTPRARPWGREGEDVRLPNRTRRGLRVSLCEGHCPPLAREAASLTCRRCRRRRPSRPPPTAGNPKDDALSRGVHVLSPAAVARARKACRPGRTRPKVAALPKPRH